MPSTTNFGWTTPADTDLVKDGAAAIRTLGNGIDTSFVDLKGGTTGQVLSKASNTDLDFTWVAQDDSNAIQNALLTTTGDTIYASSASTPARLGIGSTGQVLTVSGGVPVWATPAGGGKVLQIVQDTTTTLETTTSSSYIDTALSQAITPSAATSKVLVIAQINGYSYLGGGSDVAALYNVVRTSTQLCEQFLGGKFSGLGSSVVMVYLDSPNTTSSTTYKVQMKKVDGDARILATNLSSLTLIEIGA